MTEAGIILERRGRLRDLIVTVAVERPLTSWGAHDLCRMIRADPEDTLAVLGEEGQAPRWIKPADLPNLNREPINLERPAPRVAPEHPPETRPVTPAVPIAPAGATTTSVDPEPPAVAAKHVAAVPEPRVVLPSTQPGLRGRVRRRRGAEGGPRQLMLWSD